MAQPYPGPCSILSTTGQHPHQYLLEAWAWSMSKPLSVLPTLLLLPLPPPPTPYLGRRLALPFPVSSVFAFLLL